MRKLPLPILCLVLATASGCLRLRPPEVPAPSVPLPATFGEAATDPAAPPPAWRALAGDDALLGRLLRAGVESNLNLRAASARLRAAGHLVEEARVNRYPSVRPRAGVTESQSSENDGRGGENESARQTLYDLGLDASWDLDPRGRSLLTLAATRADVDRAAAVADALRLRVQAETLRSYLRLREAQALLAVSDQAVSNQTDVLQLVDRQVQGGRATALDLARARGLVATTRAGQSLHAEAIDREIHLLSLLTALPPNGLRAELSAPRDLPAWPAGLLPGNPAELLRRRPDIRAAEAGLSALLLRARVTAGEAFPTVRLVADAGVEAEDASDLTASDSIAWSAGLRLGWTGLDTLRVRARAAAADAGTEAAVAEYEQTVLAALREVEDALSTRRHSLTRLAALEEALAAAEDALRLSSLRFADGVTDFLPVLDAERERILLREQLVSARTRVATATVTLLEAAGAGW